MDSASTSTSTASATTMLLNTTPDSPPVRPAFHLRRRRRASQPALSNSLQIATRGHLSSESEGSDTDEDLSSESWDFGARSHGRSSLEYLDLSLSLPYTLVSMRSHLLSYLSELEARVRNLSPLRAAPSGSDSHLAPFYANIESLKEDLRKLALLLPSPTAAFPFPSASALRSPTAAFAARSQSLAADWERLASTLHISLPLPSSLSISFPKLPATPNPRKLAAELEFDLPALPTLPALPSIAKLDLDFAAIWQPLANHLPSPGASLLARMHTHFDALQEAVSALTLRDCFYSAAMRQGRDESVGAPASRFEATLSTLSAKTRARASSMVQRAGTAAREAEDALYRAALELARGGQTLIRYEQLPPIWKNNEHILSGYRFIPLRNWKALLRSMFAIHNETGNIHTHLWGAVLIVPFFWPSKGLDEHTTPMDRLVQTVYLIAALKCLACSVGWHLMAGCADQTWFERFACVDYTGIALLVAASIWTTVYNGFYCQPNLALAYSISTLIVGVVGAILPWQAWFNERSNKAVRITVFLCMCFSALAPFGHAAYEHGLYKTVEFFSPIVPSLLFYIGGLVFYAAQFPESIAPGRFDILGHSHQLWHVGIVLAILAHYRAALVFHERRFAFSCAVPDMSSIGNGIGDGMYTHHAHAQQPLDALFEAAGGLEGVVGLDKADSVILGWKRAIGAIGYGAVGRVWDYVVDWVQQW